MLINAHFYVHYLLQIASEAHFCSLIALPDGEGVLVGLEVVDVLGVPLEADGGGELHVQLGRLLPRLARVRVVQRQALEQLPVVPGW